MIRLSQAAASQANLDKMVIPWPNEESAGIPKKVMTHSIKQLCLDIELSLNPGEARVLSLLEEAVVWGGRYPVPVPPAQLKPRMFSESDIDGARKFLQRFMPRKKSKPELQVTS